MQAGGAREFTCAKPVKLWSGVRPKGRTLHSTELTVHTGERECIVDLTGQAADFVAGLSDGIGEGLLTVFVPHATAGLAILELGSGSDSDLLEVLARLLPVGAHYRHAHGAPGHGRSHVMPAFLAPSVVVPVVGGRLTLGTWQSLALVDLNVDNPSRAVRLTFLAG
jgi:secondary thiamine-phosphate synthase enzyme